MTFLDIPGQRIKRTANSARYEAAAAERNAKTKAAMSALSKRKAGDAVTPTKCGITIIPDIPAHMAPSGQYISGRKAMRDDCIAQGYVPYEPVNSCPGGITDPVVAARNGTRVCEATTEWLSKAKDAYASGADRFK